MEAGMSRIVFAIATLLALAISVGPLTSKVEAMTFSTPANVLLALKESALSQNVACRKLYRCGPYGCDWKTVCWADPYSYPGTYYHGYDGPFDYGYQGFHYYYGGVPLRWTRPNRDGREGYY